MASSKQVLVIIVVVTIATILAAPAPALAADLLVGDGEGWNLDVDYVKWVEGNDFIVGDTLVFKYAKNQHSVVQATAASYAVCTQDNNLRVWTSGDDRVTLNTSGIWWFFCGVGDHCQEGMKFSVLVLPAVDIDLSPASPLALPGGGDTKGLASAQGGGLAAAVLTAAGAVAAVAALLF